MLLPKTPVSAFVFAALPGFAGAATVPPTSGLIGKLFDPAALGTLFGPAFLAHQVGSFFSAWLGGLCVAVTGGYVLIRCVEAVLRGLQGTLTSSTLWGRKEFARLDSTDEKQNDRPNEI